MKQKTRNGVLTEQSSAQDRLLRALYGSAAGRLLIKPLTAPWLSKAAGAFLSTGFSRIFIRSFIRANGIDMAQFEDRKYKSYNDFFSRSIRPGARSIDEEPSHLISPCDSKLTAMRIAPDSVFTLKHTPYTLASLLKNEALAERYAGGWALVFRLTVDDYHRYSYPDDGEKEENVRIAGVLHTVNPVANDHYPIYKENSREYTVLHSRGFGDVVIMEVGALMVGKIVNHHGRAAVRRGQEKGYFEFGGSTVVLLLEKDTVRIDEDILLNSADGIETVVRLGERIAEAV